MVKSRPVSQSGFFIGYVYISSLLVVYLHRYAVSVNNQKLGAAGEIVLVFELR